MRAGKVPDWSGGTYDSGTSRGKDDYMELGESNTWRRDPPAARVVTVESEARGRLPVAHLPSNVTSIYSDDYPGDEDPRLGNRS